MLKEFPPQFLERLKTVVPQNHYNDVLQTFRQPSVCLVRVNTLKISVQDAVERFDGLDPLPFISEAVVCDDEKLQDLKDKGIFDEGILYRQSCSSMLAVEVLAPKPGEWILDLCAAPGSKTSQIVARMDNRGKVLAVEVIRNRFYKLKSVLKLLGATNVDCLCMDGRRFQARDGLFDRVLVDAPCSSEGRFKIDEPKTFAYWSVRKIKEMVKKQRGLLLNAGRQLKSGGILVYSTCTFSPEENEGVVDWFLRKTEGQFSIEPAAVKGVDTYPVVLSWGKKDFSGEVSGCTRVLPGKIAEGFFITRFRKT